MQLRTLSLFFFLFLFFGFTQVAFAQGPTTHTINLNVNSGQIDGSSINANANFGQGEGTPNEDYEIYVRVGDMVMWRARSLSNPDQDYIKVISISKDSGRSIFSADTLTDNAQNPGVIFATVSAGDPGDVMKYTIEFEVFNGSQSRGKFKIDPKLRIFN